ncbi:MAG: flagellar export protein FliJ [Opitutaceae bacterium]|nr:flagellar export protein FliJ [Verrucomicrobiales bacterium]
MKSFRFSLQAVLTLRQRHERFALEAHAAALLARHQALARLEAAELELSAAWSDLRRRRDTGCSAAEMTQAGEFSQALSRCRDTATAALAVAERGVNSSLQNLLEVRRQREIVDACHDKQKLAHQRELARQESRLLDDLAGRRFTPLLAG